MAGRWLLCDYGEVLSRPQPAAAVAELCRLTGLGEQEFAERYWAHRPGYDRGDLTVGDYWAAVLDEHPGERLAALVDADVAGWLLPQEASVEAVRGAAREGWRLAVLSNAPAEVAAAIDALPWLDDFEPRLFSHALGRIKPEPEIYLAALERLGARPDDVVFVDDRPANVASAAELGIRALHFSGQETWAALRG